VGRVSEFAARLSLLVSEKHFLTHPERSLTQLSAASVNSTDDSGEGPSVAASLAMSSWTVKKLSSAAVLNCGEEAEVQGVKRQ